jgi:hypothetical protein
MASHVIDVPHTHFKLAETVHTILVTANACTDPTYNIVAIIDNVMVETCIHCGKTRAEHART